MMIRLSKLLRKNRSTEQNTQQLIKESKIIKVMQSLSGYSWLIILLGVILISGLCIFINYHLKNDYERTITNASQETMNLAIAFEEHVRRIIADVDKDLTNIKQAYEQHGLASSFFDAASRNASKDLSRYLVAIYNEQGIIVASSIQDVIGANRSYREYFLVHQNQDNQKLDIGELILSKTTSERIIPLTRRINKPDGSFGGIVYIGLRSDYFLSFYNKIDLGKNQRISLLGLDGFVRARQSDNDLQFDQNSETKNYKKIIQSGKSDGTFFTESSDGIRRIVSYRIMREYPLIVSVGKSTDKVLAAYNDRKDSYVLGGTVAILFILAFCALLINRHENTKRLTQAVRQDRDRLSALINSISDEVLFVDTNSQITLANPAANQSVMTGESKSKKLDSLPAISHTAWSPRPIEQASLLRALKGEAVKNEQEMFQSPANGELCYYEINSNPVRDNEGTIIGAVSVVRDITERKLLEDEIRNHRDNLQALVKEQVQKISEVNAEMVAIFESISEPFIVLDRMWKITYINKVALQKFDLTLNNNYIGEKIWEIFPGLIGSELYQSCCIACEANIPIHRMFQSNASKKIFDTHLYPYVNGLFIYMRDISEQKAYEAEMARLERLNLIGEMAASIGHEVRNPMTTVRGYLQRFTQKPAFVEYREQMKLMIEELDRANSIITEFLSLAKNKKLELKLTDLNAIILNLFPLLQADALRRGNAIELELEDIDNILADESEIRQYILNLVGNGLDAMSQNGKITISTAKVRNQIVLTVRDDGKGIPSEILDKLGTPFVTTKENGTGLGLPVCYRIAQRHNATINLETGSEGTAFHIFFKCA